MKRIPRRIFQEEFKREAIRLVNEQGLTISEACKKLDIATKSLRTWMKQEQNGELKSRPRRSQSIPGGLGPLRRMINLIGAILLHPTFLSVLPRGLFCLPRGKAWLESRMDTGLQAAAL
jgi:Transposase